MLNALERLAAGYASECDRAQGDLGIAETQLRDYQARLGKPFPHEAYLAELIELRDQLKAGLSGTAQTHDNDAKPPVSELAESIKTLKAAHNVEATPQRLRQQQSTAEEPVTARIRRRAEAIPNTDRSMPFHAADASTLRDSETQDSSVKPAMTFQERLAAERQVGV